MAIRLWMGLGMLVLALLFTGALAMGLEQLAEGRRPVGEAYVPPKIPPY